MKSLSPFLNYDEELYNEERRYQYQVKTEDNNKCACAVCLVIGAEDCIM